MNEIIVKESEPDENGIITRIEYHTDDNGCEYKVIKKVKRRTMMSKIYKSVEDRKNSWVKFGLATGDNNVTFVSPEEIFMEPPPSKEEQNRYEDQKRIQSLKIGSPIKKIEENKKDYRSDYKQVDIESVKHIYSKNTFKVFGINTDISEVDLYELFSTTCLIKQVYIPKDWKTKEPKGFAYISFFTGKDMETCFNKFNDFGYNYQRLRLEKI
jgi:RNA recognition motif-containing protein